MRDYRVTIQGPCHEKCQPGREHWTRAVNKCKKSLNLEVSWSSSHQTSTECPEVPPRYLAIHPRVSPAGDLTGPAAPQCARVPPKQGFNSGAQGQSVHRHSEGKETAEPQEDPGVLQVHMPHTNTASSFPGTPSQLPALPTGITVIHFCIPRFLQAEKPTLLTTTFPPNSLHYLTLSPAPLLSSSQ